MRRHRRTDARANESMSTTGATTDFAFFPTKRIGVVIATTTNDDDDDDDDASASASASVIVRSCGIVTQNVNGPCPLLAVVNAMLLRDDATIGEVSMSADGKDDGVDVGGVSLDGIVRVLAETMRKRALGGARADEDGRADANAVAVLNDATSALYDFASGMDVNVKFNACDGFEYTREMSVFDLCGLRLVHSWVVGEAEHGADAVRVAGDGTAYNSLVERLISLKTEIEEGVRGTNGREDVNGAAAAVGRDGGGESSAREEDLVARAVALSLADSKDASVKDAELAEKVRDASAMEDFLSTTASQLTHTGLEAMRRAIDEGEYVVWFRNNHFSVVVKRDGQLYALVTDQGYLHEPDIVWEGLGGARDGDFVDSKFQPFVPHVGDSGGGLGVEDADYEAAIAASRAESGGATTNASSSAAALPPEFLRTADVSSASGATANVDADHALALRLQAQFEEEERASRIAAERRAARSLENRRAPTASRRPEDDPSRRREKTKKKDKKKSSAGSSSTASDVCVIM